jgi:hypothetical protein
VGRADEAFADYEARNALQLRIHSPFFAGESAKPLPEVARRLAAYLRWRGRGRPAKRPPARLSAWISQIGHHAARKGAGRPSGRGNPRRGQSPRRRSLDLRSEAGWSRLQTLTPAEADASRELYWRQVHRSIGYDVSNKIVVDKLPLHTLDLHVIAKLFPDARILFALRDPRDVVLSCYRRRFQVNAAMFEFLTLAGAADFYDAAMTLAAAARAAGIDRRGEGAVPQQPHGEHAELEAAHALQAACVGPS